MVKAKLKEQTRAKKEEKKAKKRKLEEVEDTEPEPAPAAQVEDDAPIEPETEIAKDEQPAKKKSKKRKTEDGVAGGAEQKPKNQKKSKPTSKPDTETNGDPLAENEDEVALDGQAGNTKTQGKQRFIVFIGNLPYKATKENLEKHFAAIKPLAIRLQTHKDTGKSKGAAFLEFSQYDRMKTCLKKYHHTMLADDAGNERKINVELSAGGGGNSENRKTKIKGKNEKLGEERKRYMENQAKEKVKREERAAKKGGKGAGKEDKKGGKANGNDATAVPAPEHGDIHPSRLAQMRA